MAGRYLLQRTDDNGVTTVIAVLDSLSDAQAKALEFERHGHKQFYFVSRIDAHPKTDAGPT
ncbi:MAG: hypothetical protein FWD68_14310 [Alphaproteobacteria bacterium]|nr:hypothetical protein [Alphaproteobacteria bacterium]